MFRPSLLQARSCFTLTAPKLAVMVIVKVVSCQGYVGTLIPETRGKGPGAGSGVGIITSPRERRGTDHNLTIVEA